MDVRTEARQALWFAKMWPRDGRPKRRRRSARAIELPALPRQRREPGSVWAVTMVKDEADIIELAVAHLFAQGVDHVLVSDNLSTDATPHILARLAAADPRVHVARDPEPAYYQAEKMSRLAWAAWRAGADWVIPFDADEFWFARDHSLKEFFVDLGHSQPNVGLVQADFHHMIPIEPDPADLRSATFVMDATRSVPGKTAIRSHPLTMLYMGNHGAVRAGEHVSGLFIAHAAYRGPRQVARKVRQGAAAVALSDQSGVAQHWAKGAALTDDVVEQVWANISSGRPDDRINHAAQGPMVRVRPLLWPAWDPDGELG